MAFNLLTQVDLRILQTVKTIIFLVLCFNGKSSHQAVTNQITKN